MYGRKLNKDIKKDLTWGYMVLANLIKTQVDFSLYPSKLFSKHIFDKQPDINTAIERTQNH